MSLFPESSNEKFLFLPKVGEEKTVIVLGAVQRVNEENSKFSYKKQGGVIVGYYDILPVIDEETGEEINMLINVWKFYFDLKEKEDLNIKDTLHIAHPNTGEYIITKK